MTNASTQIIPQVIWATGPDWGSYADFPYRPMPTTLREVATLLTQYELPPVTFNRVEWLLNFNRGNAYDPPAPIVDGDTKFKAINLHSFRWESTAALTPSLYSVRFDPNTIAPNRRYADTLRDVAAYLAIATGIDGNNLSSLSALNGATADEHLPLNQGAMVVTCWQWAYLGGGGGGGGGSGSGSGSSGAPPPRYLRMTQRDDGMGIARHPRIQAAGANNASSKQATRSTRLGDNNTYR